MINYSVSSKLMGVMILVFGSVFVCAVFWHYAIDLKNVEPFITSPIQQAEYDGFLIMSQLMIAVAVGGIGTITLIVLLFSIGRFIAERSPELGILKALGYPMAALLCSLQILDWPSW